MKRRDTQPPPDDFLSLVTYDPKTNKVFATTLEVAERYNKRHNYVFDRVTRHIKEEAEDLRNVQTCLHISSPDFALFEGLDGMNRPLEMYAMTRTGFMRLVMGFTGFEARAWQRKFVAAFNHYEEIALRVRLNLSDPERLALRAEGKADRRIMTDALQELRMAISIVKAEGSRADDHVFDNYTRMVQKALFNRTLPNDCNLRDWLTKPQLQNLSTVERMVADYIHTQTVNVLDGTLDYHELYKATKARAQGLVNDYLGGPTEVIDYGQRLAPSASAPVALPAQMVIL